MSRLERKCLLASACLHGLLLSIALFGSAFFVPKQKPPLNLPALKVVPGRLVDDALSGGGGNPKAKPSEDRQRGETITPPPPRPEPDPPKPAPPKETARPEPAPAEKKPAQPSTKLSKPPLELKPVVRKPGDRDKKTAAAEEKKMADARRKAADQISKAMDRLKEGFASGTKVGVFGTGGEAYANYAQWVRDVYDNHWQVAPDIADDNASTLVKVTIARTGHVIASEIIKRSGNSALDKSVQRTLDKVKFVAPFPEGARDEQRTFTIEFNLKAKRMLG
jgi:TonB family protein